MFVDRRMGGRISYHTHPPKGAGMRLNDEVRKCVVFVGRPRPDGGLTITGTGFLVSMDAPRVGSHAGYFVYLVTARHVADRLPAERFGIHVRLKSGQTSVLWVDGPAWQFHPTDADRVDLAIVSPRLDLSEVDVRLIPVENILTDGTIEERGIGPGDEVYITGLFNRLQDEPIVRTGNIAAMPRAPIPGVKIGWRQACDSEGYLIEVRSLGGLSGSPIFVRQTVGMHITVEKKEGGTEELPMFGGGPFYLLGLMHGHWKIKPGEHDRVDFETTQEEGSVAVGLSIAVPGKKILDILNSAESVVARDEAKRRWYEEWGTTTSD